MSDKVNHVCNSAPFDGAPLQSNTTDVADPPEGDADLYNSQDDMDLEKYADELEITVAQLSDKIANMEEQNNVWKLNFTHFFHSLRKQVLDCLTTHATENRVRDNLLQQQATKIEAIDRSVTKIEELLDASKDEKRAEEEGVFKPGEKLRMKLNKESIFIFLEHADNGKIIVGDSIGREIGRSAAQFERVPENHDMAKHDDFVKSIVVFCLLIGVTIFFVVALLPYIYG